MTATPALHSVEDFDAWLAEKQAEGQGYAEAGSDDSGYPFLGFSFRDGCAVVHWFPSPEQVLLLIGNAVVDEDEAVEFPVQEGVCPFTGRFISDLAHARHAATALLRDGSTDGLGRWEPL